MAINRSFYLETLRSVLVRTYHDNGWKAFYPIIKSAVDYVKAGGTAQIRADRRDALRAMLSALWNSNNAQFDGHTLHHILTDAGVADDDAEDIPNTAEPQS